MDAIFLAKVDNLLLGKAGVVLNLVDGGDHSGVREELLEIPLAVLFFFLMVTNELLNKGETKRRRKTYVADTNRLGLAGRKSGLHLFPPIDVVVVVDDISLAVGQSRELIVVA